ncbi:adenine-specific DNA-methyltransferase [Azospirillaceae bacterium]
MQPIPARFLTDFQGTNPQEKKPFFGDSSSISRQWSDHTRVAVVNGDVLETLPSLPDGFARLIISSPPYNIGKSYEKKQDLDAYIDWQTTVISQIVRVLAPSGSLCWQVGNYVNNGEIFPLDVYLYPIFKKFGLSLRNRIIWHFNHGLHAKKRFSGRYETLLWFTSGNDYLFHLDPVRVPAKYPGKTHYKGKKRGQPSGNPLGKNPSDFWSFLKTEWDDAVWDIPNVKSNHPEKTEHPCQFPIELVERCILALTNPDDWVLDPFCGAGSTHVAALKHHRKAIGIEQNPTYCAIAEQRIQKFYAGELKIRPLGKPIHTPSEREKTAQRPGGWTSE